MYALGWALERCRHCAPKTVASSVELHGECATGGCQRSLPIGGSAYGMPLNIATPASVLPRTEPKPGIDTTCASAAEPSSSGKSTRAIFVSCRPSLR